MGASSSYAFPLVGQPSITTHASQLTGSIVDFNKYISLPWFEIARLNNSFQQKGTYGKATYSKSPSAESITVKNESIDTVSGNIVKSIQGSATREAPNLSSLRVSFGPLIPSGNYSIVWIDSEYSIVAVASKSKKYLWIMVRNRKNIDSSLLNACLTWLKHYNFNVSALSWSI